MDEIVNRFLFIKNIDKKGYGLYECSCGNIKSYRKSSVGTNTKSCGCLQRERNNNLIHGLSYTKEYNAWRGMKARCYNINHSKYKNYGAREIIVCDRWFSSFENFFEDMNLSPSKSHSIDRIDVNGNYCKKNCRWATYFEQNYNKTNTVIVTYKGETKPLQMFCNDLKLNYMLINKRIKSGWNIEKSFEKKITKEMSKKDEDINE